MKDQKAEEQRFSIKCAAGNDRAMADGLETCPRTKSHSWQHVCNMTITGEMIEQHPQIYVAMNAGEQLLTIASDLLRGLPGSILARGVSLSPS